MSKTICSATLHSKGLVYFSMVIYEHSREVSICSCTVPLANQGVLIDNYRIHKEVW